MTSDFSMFYEKMSDFVWFPLFVLTLVIKTLIFDQKKKKKDIRFEYVLSNSNWMNYASLFELNFANKLRNTNFKLYWNSLIFLISGIYCQIKICPAFFILFVFFSITIENVSS